MCQEFMDGFQEATPHKLEIGQTSIRGSYNFGKLIDQFFHFSKACLLLADFIFN